MNPPNETLPLRDIHLPDPVSWWPPAPGWWLSLGLLILVAVLLVYLRRRHRRRALQRGAQRALGDIAAEWRQTADTGALARDLSILLRRVCLSRYPRERVAGLTGNDWLRQLDTPLAGDDFQNGIGRALVDAPYAAEPRVDGDALLQLCERWVNRVTRPEGARP